MRWLRQALFVALVVVLLDTPAAYAYLDAGSISLLLQAIVGTIAGATVVLGIYWRKTKNFIFGKREEPSDAAPASAVRRAQRDR